MDFSFKFAFIHGWAKTSVAFGLFLGFSNIFYIRSIASLETPSNSGISVLYSLFFTASNISASVSPKNGGTPDNKIYNITPADQISQL